MHPWVVEGNESSLSLWESIARRNQGTCEYLCFVVTFMCASILVTGCLSNCISVNGDAEAVESRTRAMITDSLAPTKERAEDCPRIVVDLHSKLSVSLSASSEPVLSMISRASDPTSEESVGRR